jgi:hypothetical protein
LSSKLISLLVAKEATVPRHPNEGDLVQACQLREGIQALRNQPWCLDVTFGLLSALSATWPSEKIRIRCFC